MIGAFIGHLFHFRQQWRSVWANDTSVDPVLLTFQRDSLSAYRQFGFQKSVVSANSFC
jgi:hypothetical protein